MNNTPTIAPMAFRKVLGEFATGVTVMTTTDQQGHKVGMTVSSFNALSLTPPLILWSIDKNTGCFDAFNDCQHFAVHVLSEEQADVSSRFASKGIDKFAGIDCETSPNNTPLLTEYCARLECKTEHRYEGGDHIIIVGRVIHMDNQQRNPLLFHQGRYASIEAFATAN